MCKDSSRNLHVELEIINRNCKKCLSRNLDVYRRRSEGIPGKLGGKAVDVRSACRGRLCD